MNENLKLSTETIQILYRDCLYGIPHETPKSVLPKDTPEFKDIPKGPSIKSQNSTLQKKKFVVITDLPLTQNIADQRFKFLSEIIKACKVDIGEGIITDILHEGKDYNQLQENYQPDVFLLFGISPADIQLPMIFPNFQVQKSGKQTYISAPSLDALEPDKTSKTKLWNCLKQAFVI